MKIVSVYSPYIYSIQYDEAEEKEFDSLFELWNDVGYVVGFMEENKSYLKSYIWNGLSGPEDARF